MLINERRTASYVISAASSEITLTTPAGGEVKITVPLLKEEIDARKIEVNRWARGVQLSTGRLDGFVVAFPDVYVNGQRININPIHFSLDRGRYTSVLNC